VCVKIIIILNATVVDDEVMRCDDHDHLVHFGISYYSGTNRDCGSKCGLEYLKIFDFTHQKHLQKCEFVCVCMCVLYYLLFYLILRIALEEEAVL